MSPISKSELEVMHDNLLIPMEAKAALVNLICYEKPPWLSSSVREVLERLLLTTDYDGLSYQNKQEIAEHLHLSGRTVYRALTVLVSKRLVRYDKVDEAYEVQCENLHSVLAQELQQC